jgi:hypothetical protein
MILQIPSEITLDYIKSLKQQANNIDIETARILNNFISYDIEELDASDDLEEEDLYNLTSDDLKIKKAARDHLIDAIDIVLSPRIGIKDRLGTPVASNSISYVIIKEDTYAMTGYQSTYMSKGPNKAYKFLTALSVSSIITI